MEDRWNAIADAVRSGDPDRVDEATDAVQSMDADERARLFEVGFDDLVAIYEHSDDGYVRQSAIRIAEAFTPGVTVAAVASDDDNGLGTDELHRRVDALCGFSLETLQDEDGRVRLSTQRVLKQCFRSYDVLGNTATISALARELEDVAEQYSGSRREHVLETVDDAEWILEPGGPRFGEVLGDLLGDEG